MRVNFLTLEKFVRFMREFPSIALTRRRWGKRARRKEQTRIKRIGLINSNGLLPKCKSRNTAAGARQVSETIRTTFCNWLSPYCLSSEHPRGWVTFVLAYKYFSIFLATQAPRSCLPSLSHPSSLSLARFLFGIRFVLNDQSFPRTGHEQYAPCGTIVFATFLPRRFLPPSIRSVYPTENHWRRGTFGTSSNLTFV